MLFWVAVETASPRLPRKSPASRCTAGRHGGLPDGVGHALNPSDSDFSEKLSMKVLNSLRSLNSSLGEVRDSVAKIDLIAHSNISSVLASRAVAPPSTPGGGPSDKKGLFIGTAALPPSGSASQANAVPHAGSSTSSNDAALKTRLSSLEELLRKVCLSAASPHGTSGLDEATWAQLRQVRGGAVARWGQ